MNFVFSRQQSLFHVLAAYSIYNTVSQSTATQVFLRSWGGTLWAPLPLWIFSRLLW